MPGRRSVLATSLVVLAALLGGCDSDRARGPDRRPHRLSGAVPWLRGRTALRRRAPVPRARRAPRGNGAERRGHRDRGRRSAGRARSRLPGDRRAHRVHRGGPTAPRDRARRRGRRRRVGGDARPRAPVSRCAVREHGLGRAGDHLAPAGGEPRALHTRLRPAGGRARGIRLQAARLAPRCRRRRRTAVRLDGRCGLHRRVLRARWTGRGDVVPLGVHGPARCGRTLARREARRRRDVPQLPRRPRDRVELVGVGARRPAATPRLGSDPRGPGAPAGARRQARRRGRHHVAPVGSRVARPPRLSPSVPHRVPRPARVPRRPVHGARVPQRRRGDPQSARAGRFGRRPLGAARGARDDAHGAARRHRVAGSQPAGGSRRLPLARRRRRREDRRSSRSASCAVWSRHSAGSSPPRRPLGPGRSPA